MFGDVKRHFVSTCEEGTFDDIEVILDADNGGVHATVKEFGTELGTVNLRWAPDPTKKLADEHGGTWGAHAGYPVEDWQYEVGNGDTRLGYWEWVEAKIEQATRKENNDS